MCNEGIQRNFSLCHTGQLIALVSGESDFFRQSIQNPLSQVHVAVWKHFLPGNDRSVFFPGNHSGKGSLDAADFLALFNDSGFIDRDGSSKHITKKELIFSCFQNESIGKSGLSGIIEGRKGSFIKAKGDGFGFAGSKQLRFRRQPIPLPLCPVSLEVQRTRA